MQLEDRIEQQHGITVELDSFTSWLKTFTDESKVVDKQVRRIFFLSNK